MNNLINKLMQKIFPKENDEMINSLENHYNNFLKRIKNYGFENMEEYENTINSFEPSINKYPVNCDC
ncbi:MAG: hypothetical protein WC812_04845 [Candidatus Pacearchaeota archaeon]|jgi:hypothetical protein